MTSATFSQLSSFPSTSRVQIYRFQPRSLPILRQKIAATYTEDAPNSQNGRSLKLDGAAGQEAVPIKEESESIEEHAVTEQIRAAKIHDFCLGIPFGGLVLSGGVVGSIALRNTAILGTGVLFGGSLLALSTLSLKVWRTGKSSLPFMLGQAVLAAVLTWQNIQAYSLTKQIFPAGFFAVISAAMLCFYTYVVMSGGNPPPKKKKVSVDIRS